MLLTFEAIPLYLQLLVLLLKVLQDHLQLLLVLTFALTLRRILLGLAAALLTTGEED